MKLTGEYTAAGAALSAQVLSGASALNLTRAVAGSGNTQTAAATLENEQMTLGLAEHTVNGSTLTVPVKLLSLQAPNSFMLTEIGLYALSGESQEILYKIYRLDQPISVDSNFALNATFYLSDTVIPGNSVGATISPAGFMTAEQGDDLRALIPTGEGIKDIIGNSAAFPTETVTITTTGANLQTEISALPKLIDKNIVIEVTSNVSGQVTIKDFTGPGTLMIKSSVKNTKRTISGAVLISNVNLTWMYLVDFTISTSSLLTFPAEYRNATTTNNKAHLQVVNCDGRIVLKRLMITRPGSKSKDYGYYVESSAFVMLEQCYAQNRVAYCMITMMSYVIIHRDPESVSPNFIASDCDYFCDATRCCRIRCTPQTYLNSYIGAAGFTYQSCVFEHDSGPLPMIDV